MPSHSHAYPPSYLWIMIVIFSGGSASAAIVTMMLDSLGYITPGIRSYTFLYVLSIVYLWAAATAFVVRLLYVVHVDDAGLSCRTFWGARKKTSWDNIAAADMAGVPGLRFVRIALERGGAPLWMPLFIRRRRELAERIAGYAGAGNPVARILSR